MLRNALVLLLLLAAGCSQSLYMQGRNSVEQGQYDRAIDYLYKEIQTNPESFEAWRELGIAFYNKGDLIKAEDALKQANSIQPDARTNLFMGLILEQQREFDRAIAAYSASLNLKAESKTKAMIRAHLDNLVSRKLKEDAFLAVENESKIDVDTIPANSIAVVDFDGSQLPPDLAPVSRGLAEFTAIDLSKVSSLRVVDRLKIDALLNELKLSSLQSSDPHYAPRVGRLLGGRRIITGSVLSAGDNRLQLNGAVVNTADSSTELTGPTEGDLSEFFKLQKDFVFKVIDSLGVQLTLEERDAINEVPTESFLAFIAYCRGLDYQSQGNIDAARREFQTAAANDKGFVQAGSRAEALKASPGAGGQGEGSFQEFESSVTEASDQEMEDLKLDIVQNNIIINSGFIRDRLDYDRFGFSPRRPPVTSPTVNVGIKGDIDGK